MKRLLLLTALALQAFLATNAEDIQLICGEQNFPMDDWLR